MGSVPDHPPGSAESNCPCRAVPPTTGGEVFVGGDAAAAVAGDAAAAAATMAITAKNGRTVPLVSVGRLAMPNLRGRGLPRFPRKPLRWVTATGSSHSSIGPISDDLPESMQIAAFFRLRRPLGQRHGGVVAVAVPVEGDGQLVARLVRVDRRHRVAGGADALALDRGDH